MWFWFVKRGIVIPPSLILELSMWQIIFQFVFLCFYCSTLSTAQHQEWSPVWWAVLHGCIPHQWLLAGRRSQLQTPATQAHPCTPRDMETLVTCTPPWLHAEILNMSTCNTFPALPTSMGKPPQVGLNEKRLVSAKPIILWVIKTSCYVGLFVNLL